MTPEGSGPDGSDYPVILPWVLIIAIYAALGGVLGLALDHVWSGVIGGASLGGLFAWFRNAVVFEQALQVFRNETPLQLIRRGAPFLAALAAIWALLSYVGERDDRRQERINTAWATVAAAHSVPDAAGRADALETLHDEGVSLETVDASGGFLRKLTVAEGTFRRGDLSSAFADSAVFYKADVREVDFSRSDLRWTNYDSANIYSADLRGAQASQSSFRQANLFGVEMRSARAPTDDVRRWLLNEATRRVVDLAPLVGRMGGRGVADSVLTVVLDSASKISLSNPWFQAVNADFTGAVLARAHLNGAYVPFSDFQRANLYGASVDSADFRFTDLRGANLCGIEGWDSMHLLGANIAGAKNPPEGFTKYALSDGAVEVASNSAWQEFREQSTYSYVFAPPGMIPMPRTAYRIVYYNCVPLTQERQEFDVRSLRFCAESPASTVHNILQTRQIPGHRVPEAERPEEDLVPPCN